MFESATAKIVPSVRTVSPASPQTYVLAKATPAYERFGHLSRLPPGATLKVTGDGFSDRTVRVESSGVSYVVFRRDLENDEDEQENRA
jgi:hypothetical protein